MGVFGDAWNYGKQMLHKDAQILGLAGPSTPAAPPGAAQGPPPVPGRLVHNADGSSTDPVTGQNYVADGKGGLTAQQTPNLAQQSGAALARAPGFYNNAADVYGQQQGLANTLTNLANGAGPTVAGTQNQIMLDQGQKQQLAQAAGASGGNAALARLGAAANTGALAANANQTGALARAQEQTSALNSLGGLLDTTAGQQLGAGQALTGLGMQGMNDQEQLQYNASKAAADANNQDTQNKQQFVTSAINAYGKVK